MTSDAAGCTSLEAAIREKYCSSDGSEETLLPAKKQIKETAVYMRPGMLGGCRPQAREVNSMQTGILNLESTRHIQSVSHKIFGACSSR